MAKLLRHPVLLQVILSSLLLCTHAHMEMSWPYPIRSQLDPAVAEADKDYSYTSPLLADGSNFPCKGYQNGDDSTVVKAVYTAGNTYNMTIAGTVTHDGGSCQLSLSYDNGATFKVIQSMIGGCPLVPGYNFTIPSFAPPSSSVLLAWSWFNLIGNREMYMDCARVAIQAPTPGRHRRAVYKRQASMDLLPDMFACNVNNGCTSIQNENVNFPFPGTNIIYGQDLIVPTNGTGFTGSGFTGDVGPNGTSNGTISLTSAPFGNGTSSTAFPTIATASLITTSTFISLATLTSTNSDLATVINGTLSFFPTSATTTAIITSPTTAAAFSTASSSSSSSSSISISGIPPLPIQEGALPATLTTSSIGAITPTAEPATCNPGVFFCSTPSTFSTCVSSSPTTFTYMGPVAAGMTCVNTASGGQIIRQNAGLCTPSGQIFCNGSTAFYMCDQGGLIDMGAVASGTQCVNGVIMLR